MNQANWPPIRDPMVPPYANLTAKDLCLIDAKITRMKFLPEINVNFVQTIDYHGNKLMRLELTHDDV